MTEKEILRKLGLFVGPISKGQRKDKRLEYFTDADGNTWGVRRPSMKPVTYFSKDGFSIGEGGPRCLHISSRKISGHLLFIHLYIRLKGPKFFELIVKIS